MTAVLSDIQAELIRLREEVTDLRKILRQAGYICAHCDQPIDSATKYLDPYRKRWYHVVCEGRRSVAR